MPFKPSATSVRRLIDPRLNVWPVHLDNPELPGFHAQINVRHIERRARDVDGHNILDRDVNNHVSGVLWIGHAESPKKISDPGIQSQ